MYATNTQLVNASKNYERQKEWKKRNLITVSSVLRFDDYNTLKLKAKGDRMTIHALIKKLLMEYMAKEDQSKG